MRVLVVEDEPKMGSLIRRGLERSGLAVDVVGDGEEALWRAATVSYDAILLDRMLPGIDGTEVCRRLRRDGIRSPVLMLTAMGEIADRVGGLDSGADDYLAKPFHFDELLARVRALARRGPVNRAPVLEASGLRLDPATHEVWRGEAPIDLTAKEFALLEAFMRHPGQVLSKDALLEQAWDGTYENRSNVVEAHISSLRDTLDRPCGCDSIEQGRGVGYRLRRD
jgi:two-component system OmpR family response regulator